MSGARLVLTSSAVGFMRARSAAVTSPSVDWHQSHVQREDVALLEEGLLAARRRVVVDGGLRPRGVASPDEHAHAKCAPVACDH